MLLAGVLKRKLLSNRFLVKHMKNKEMLAFDLFIESVLEPDYNLRAEAHDLECYNELMKIREDVLQYLYNVRNK